MTTISYARDETCPPYLLFWGKAHANEDSLVKWHPAAYHCLDVAAVAQQLLRLRQGEVRRMSQVLDVSPEDFTRLNVFLVALHDIGKFSRCFQGLAAEIQWPKDVLGEWSGERYSCSHWQISHELLAKELRNHLLDLLKLDSCDDIEPLIRSVAGHHGSPPSNNEDIEEAWLCSTSINMAEAFLDDVADLLKPPAASWLEDEYQQKKLSYWLAGLTVVSDWLGSNSKIFEYCAPDLSLSDYWQKKALPRAKEALTKSGLFSATPIENATFESLFDIKAPRPMQQAMTDLPLSDGPMLVIIEDATGSGKTEASILLAQRMMAAGKASGLYFALPTMATANAMFSRMKESYRYLFAPNAKPSLALAHGRRELDKKWFAALTPPEQMTASLAEPNEETSAQCAQWIADDRRRTFLAQIGVGTIDQALLAVLPSKFQSLRLWGLSDRIIIVDEAHAYDAYMSKELERLLEFHAANNGSAIVLSATLPGEKRKQLTEAFYQGIGKKQEVENKGRNAQYPLVTIARQDKMDLIENISPSEHSIRKVYAERLTNADTAIERIAKAAEKGAAVAFIRNAVDDAIEAVKRLRQSGIRADLFHARYVMGDRQEIEQQAVDLFGKKGRQAERKGRVLVATQVIEQSLDLDFDLMVSDLAPIDLLIQRAGRLWRHMDRPPEEKRPVEGPKLLVISPDPARVKNENWLFDLGHKGAYVYPNHALLWRTAKILFDNGGFKVPGDLRQMIEYVYDDLYDAESPKALKAKDKEYDGTIWGDRTSASFNLLDLKNGYVRAGSWLEENAVHTRLGEPTRTIRLARIEGDRLVPYCRADPETRAWALSEISINAKWLEGAITATEWQQAAKLASNNWPKWQQNEILIAPVEAGNLLLEALPAALIYSENGLEKATPDN